MKLEFILEARLQDGTILCSPATEAYIEQLKKALQFYVDLGPAMACGASIEDAGDVARNALKGRTHEHT